MMGQEEVGSDQTSQMIIKGKRTKRQRSLSTFVVATTATTVTSTSSSTAGGGEGGRAAFDEYNSVVSSPVTTDCTEEEEDMAICLIMLARGTVPSPDLKNSRKTDKKISPENSSFYVYECKTCSRTFPSFQALGGHRASHKKPRLTSTEEKTKLPLITQPKSSVSEEGQISQFKVSGSALASQASNIIITKANKVHECSICGSEFTSGQALGGHMRRHRTVTAAVSPTAATVEISRNSSESLDRSIEQRKYLSLDLNLPAPEDDLRDSKFQGILFSATPALIDCHY